MATWNNEMENDFGVSTASFVRLIFRSLNNIRERVDYDLESSSLKIYRVVAYKRIYAFHVISSCDVTNMLLTREPGHKTKIVLISQRCEIN